MPIFPARIIVPAPVSAIPNRAFNPVSRTFGPVFAHERLAPFAGFAEAYLALQHIELPGAVRRLAAFAPVTEAFDTVFTHEPFPPFAAIRKAYLALPLGERRAGLHPPAGCKEDV
jgi:hypothetical protein